MVPVNSCGGGARVGLLGESSGSRWIQGLSPILTTGARKTRVWTREGTCVGRQAGESLTRSLKRRTKRRSRLGKALRERRRTQLPSGRLSHGGRDHGTKSPHWARHHLPTRWAKVLAQRLVERLTGKVHVAGGWIARALGRHIKSWAHRVGRERRGLSTKWLGTPSSSSAIAWGYLARHAPLYTKASKGHRTAKEWRACTPHLRGSEVILKGVGSNQMIHHGSWGRCKLRQMRVCRTLSVGLSSFLFRALHLQTGLALLPPGAGRRRGRCGAAASLQLVRWGRRRGGHGLGDPSQRRWGMEASSGRTIARRGVRGSAAPPSCSKT